MVGRESGVGAIFFFGRGIGLRVLVVIDCRVAARWVEVQMSNLLNGMHQIGDLMLTMDLLGASGTKLENGLY